MKHLLLTTIAAVVLVGCGPSMSIHDAAKSGDFETVKEHLEGGADVNVKNEGGFTPLHYAALHGHKNGFILLHGHKKTVELLLAKGADVNVKSKFGETPLDYALGEIADLLRKHGGKTGEELKAEGK